MGGLLVDTNIWCYYFDAEAPEHEAVASYVEKKLGQTPLIINTVVLMELAHFLVKNLGAVRGKEKLQYFLRAPVRIIDFSYDLALTSIDMLSKYNYTGIGGRDATILATLKKQETDHLVSHDNAFRQIEWIHVIDPVKKSDDA